MGGTCRKACNFASWYIISCCHILRARATYLRLRLEKSPKVFANFSVLIETDYGGNICTKESVVAKETRV